MAVLFLLLILVIFAIFSDLNQIEVVNDDILIDMLQKETHIVAFFCKFFFDITEKMIHFNCKFSNN